MIIESIVSTISEKGNVNFAPFGVTKNKKEIIKNDKGNSKKVTIPIK